MFIKALMAFFTSPLVAAYFVLLAISFHVRVLLVEEKWLAREFGDDWIKF